MTKKTLTWLLIITLLLSQLTPVLAGRKKTFAISGMVSGLLECEGIEVCYTLNDEQKSVLTGPGGEYIIEGVPCGVNVVISPSEQDGYTSSADLEIKNIRRNKTGKYIIYTLKEYTITGKVQGLPNCANIEVRHTLGGELQPSVYTDESGEYTITNLPHGSNVVVIPSIQTGHTPIASITINGINDNAADQNIIYTANKYFLSGNIKGLLSGNSGIEVYYKIGDGETRSVTTGATGSYTINGIEYGSSVLITPSEQEGYTSSEPINVSPVTNSRAVSDITYTIKKFTVNGTITGLDSAAEMQLIYKIDGGSNQKVTADQDGKYTIDDVQYGSTVVISPPNIIGYSVAVKTIENVKEAVAEANIPYSLRTYTLRYSDGTTMTDPITLEYRQTITIEENSFTPPSGWEFLLWNTRENFRGDDFQPGDTFTMGTENVVLYAKWNYIPSSGGGGGGGGSGGATVKPEVVVEKPKLIIVAVDDYNATIYQETLEVEEGTQRVVKAPQITGYRLVDDESKTITIRTGDNRVTFKFTINRGIALNKTNHIKYIDGYEDGRMQPEKLVTRAEVAAIFFRLAVNEDKNDPIPNAFHDIPNDAWYAQAVNYLAQNGVLLGYENGEFRPTAVISRAEFTALAARLEKLEQSSLDLFKDVSGQHWAHSYINSAALKGWVTGFPDGAFRPEEGITRAQVVVIANRMLGRKVHSKDIPQYANGFKDVAKDYWGYADIMEATTTHEHDFGEDGYETWR